MKVKFLTSVAGVNFAYRPKKEYDLPERIARDFIRAGQAVEVREAPALERAAAQAVETAVESAPEQAVSRVGNGKRNRRGRVLGLF